MTLVDRYKTIEMHDSFDLSRSGKLLLPGTLLGAECNHLVIGDILEEVMVLFDTHRVASHVPSDRENPETLTHSRRRLCLEVFSKVIEVKLIKLYVVIVIILRFSEHGLILSLSIG